MQKLCYYIRKLLLVGCLVLLESSVALYRKASCAMPKSIAGFCSSHCGLSLSVDSDKRSFMRKLFA